jgi:heme-degrading monooxygenase HmoA
MAGTTIRPGSDVMTLVNVFTVAPSRQQELVDALVAATENVMADMPGFVSANIHRSDDGTRVVNYAQWRSREDFAAMRQNERATEHMRLAAEIAEFDPIVCEVAYTHHA